MKFGKGNKYLPYIFIAPAVALTILLTLLPDLYSVILSFTNYSLFHFKKFDFVGFRNYLHIVSGAEVWTFLRVLVWTLAWSFLSVAGMVTVGMLLAIPLNNKNLRFKNFYRTLFIIPWAIPAFITVLMWQGILNSDMGAVNVLLTKVFGLKNTIPWLEKPNLARFSVLLVNIWLGFPFMMSICLGALQAIPRNVYEAASVDGASPARQFFSITIPLLRSAMLPVLISSFAFNFNQFGAIYLLTEGGPILMGSKAGATDILVTYSYKLAFNLFQFGRACAYAVIIFLIIATISSINFKLTGAFEER